MFMKSERRSTEKRKTEIIQATLKLAESLPVAKISTRKIAREVGLSQPALFRHFRSSGDLFNAVIEYVREQLAARAQSYFESDQLQAASLKEKLNYIMGGLAEYRTLPKFFYFYASQKAESAGRTRFMLFLSMIQALVAALISEAPEVPESTDEKQAADYLISLIQGQLIGYFDLENHPERGEPSQSEAAKTERARETIANIIAFWYEGVKQGKPEKSAFAEPAKQPKKAFSKLDVRPLVASGIDPFNEIMDSLSTLERNGCLLLITPFKPSPLLSLLKSRNMPVSVKQIDQSWHLVILASKDSCFYDFSDLPAPEPLEKTLEVVSTLPAKSCLWVCVPKMPNLLIPHLTNRGLSHRAHATENPPVYLQILNS
ncbi:MAG: hypothetical protein CR997_13440 [Acidobacteria bacterium]|nr:MAG: hypothetical protein CR997_13440 [Acidobacteriota bacterium]